MRQKWLQQQLKSKVLSIYIALYQLQTIHVKWVRKVRGPIAQSG